MVRCCQILERYNHYNIQSCGFKTSRGLVVRRLTALRIEALVIHCAVSSFSLGLEVSYFCCCFFLVFQLLFFLPILIYMYACPITLEGEEPWALFQYPIRCLIISSCKVSKPQDWYLGLSNRPEIWQAPQQHYCWCAYQISKWYEHSDTPSRTFETLRDLTIRRLILSDIETRPRWQ